MTVSSVDKIVDALANKLTHTVEYKRVVQVRPYETATASIFLQFSTDRDATVEEIVAGANEQFLLGKGLIFTQLGLDADLDDTGVLMETLVDREFGPGVEKVKSLPAARKAATVKADVPDVGGKDVAGAGASSSVPAQPPFPGTTRDKDQKRANREWAEARLESNPDEFFDNRADKAAGAINPKSPDFKHRDSGVGVWLPDAA